MRCQTTRIHPIVWLLMNSVAYLNVIRQQKYRKWPLSVYHIIWLLYPRPGDGVPLNSNLNGRQDTQYAPDVTETSHLTHISARARIPSGIERYHSWNQNYPCFISLPAICWRFHLNNSANNKLRYQTNNSIAIDLISAQNPQINPLLWWKESVTICKQRLPRLIVLSPRSQRPPGTRGGSQYNANANADAN